ncbi:MazG nucleotide pyrophosphohydrolase domain-containing protein [Arthrobacter cryoconiti]|uniref:MazG nucleotide pyrophosphohydrolase domain-containing protein n=1 Tax=Arthrobacter cryoconiti TaxID=748907 RepID=A0ABV8R4X6_9MICC|nr:MazG nucleotide pyrophosphohydrolase domain-containing protein [Arthrobacter cryoconiti]MCC9066937.1 nucleotide pyrophosphohydrolase [Arthrobacter cryoconiti]
MPGANLADGGALEPVETGGAAVERLAEVIAALREHCAWTAALTHESLISYLLEEAHELTGVVEAPGPLDTAELVGELGDVLYQVMLHALLAQEAGAFTLADVAQTLHAKLIRRNPHVFHPDGTLADHFPDSIAEIERSYEAAKSAEPAAAMGTFGSIPPTLPALSLAAKTLDRLWGRGVEQPLPAGHPQTEEELGKVLFDVVRGARTQGLDAERALRAEVRRVQNGSGTA